MNPDVHKEPRFFARVADCSSETGFRTLPVNSDFTGSANPQTLKEAAEIMQDSGHHTGYVCEFLDYNDLSIALDNGQVPDESKVIDLSVY